MKTLFIVVISLVFNVYAEDHKHEHHEHHQEMASEPATPGESLYNIETTWTTFSNKPFKLKSLKGNQVVLAMVYLNCQYTCPMTISHMKQIENSISKEKLKNTKFVLVSFDPQNDTPSKMTEYKKKQQLNDRWTLMTSKKEEDLRELAGVLGVKYKKMADGEISHSFMITLLDQSGIIKKQLIGTDQSPKEFAKEL